MRKLTSSGRFRTNQNQNMRKTVCMTPTHIPTILQVTSLSTHLSPCIVVPGICCKSLPCSSKILQDAINRMFASFHIQTKWQIFILLGKVNFIMKIILTGITKNIKHPSPILHKMLFGWLTFNRKSFFFNFYKFYSKFNCNKH